VRFSFMTWSIASDGLCRVAADPALASFARRVQCTES
jgi:hypothetical protein